ncbi:hypothetical protein BD310DRAFT_328116 [Dichomitus squalens]|uniref:Uncharacterized protein n=1 Tax=Dichomitus squalens TaxID=114155 RepID=A0A4Q9Q040_9APHY|nr:hypothetical protein BD310DRAFT_328116 [Dichomitus squalens]
MTSYLLFAPLSKAYADLSPSLACRIRHLRLNKVARVTVVQISSVSKAASCRRIHPHEHDCVRSPNSPRVRFAMPEHIAVITQISAVAQGRAPSQFETSFSRKSAQIATGRPSYRQRVAADLRLFLLGGQDGRESLNPRRF